LLHCNSGFNYCNCHFRRYVINLSGYPRNGLSVPKSQTTPRNASPVPRNRSDVPRNAKIVPGNILAPGNDPAVSGNAGTVPRNAENQSSTRDTLLWATCTFHTLGNKVLHKTRCAKDRGRLKDTFGNRFEVYGYDADDRVLHEDDWHFKLMRWQLIASESKVSPSSERSAVRADGSNWPTAGGA